MLLILDKKIRLKSLYFRFIQLHSRVHLLPLKNEKSLLVLSPFFVQGKSHFKTAQKKKLPNCLHVSAKHF